MPEDKRVERVCEECGELFYGNVRQRLCAKCRVFRAEDRRLRERSRRKSNRLARLCKTCGTPIWDQGLQYCPDCRKPGDRPIREAACRTCGGPLMANETQQCAKCKAVMTETYHRILTQTGRAPTLRELAGSDLLSTLRQQTFRKCRLSGDQIAALAWYYDQPYNSYGKLRAYIEAFDQLPPDEFLKSSRPNRSDQMEWKGECPCNRTIHE
jgi:hypothetical protein